MKHRHHEQPRNLVKATRSRHNSFLSSNLFIASLLLVLLATLIPLSLASSTCSHHEYWNMAMDQCMPCMKCNKHQLVIRPCQRHLDTVCQPLNSIEIDWSKSLATEKSSSHHQSAMSARASVDEEEVIWDWQMVSLVLAVVACLMFFIGTAFISINYIRQWRKIKKQFDNGECKTFNDDKLEKLSALKNSINRNQEKSKNREQEDELLSC